MTQTKTMTGHKVISKFLCIKKLDFEVKKYWKKGNGKPFLYNCQESYMDVSTKLLEVKLYSRDFYLYLAKFTVYIV